MLIYHSSEWFCIMSLCSFPPWWMTTLRDWHLERRLSNILSVRWLIPKIQTAPIQEPVTNAAVRRTTLRCTVRNASRQTGRPDNLFMEWEFKMLENFNFWDWDLEMEYFSKGCIDGIIHIKLLSRDPQVMQSFLALPVLMLPVWCCFRVQKRLLESFCCQFPVKLLAFSRQTVAIQLASHRRDVARMLLNRRSS